MYIRDSRVDLQANHRLEESSSVSVRSTDILSTRSMSFRDVMREAQARGTDVNEILGLPRNDAAAEGAQPVALMLDHLQAASDVDARRQRMEDLLAKIINRLFMALTGGQSGAGGESGDGDLQQLMDMARGEDAGGAPAFVGGGGRVRVEELEQTTELRVTEIDTTSFCSRGTVCTADGREIGFEVGFELSHSETTVATEKLQGRRYHFQDPLAISYGGPVSDLSGEKIPFDLDGDGQNEALPIPGGGAGWLVFDRNDNGQVDDGSELFGTSSGNGFADLAQLDADGNGWIDEADPAYAEMGVWDRGSDGQQRVRSLKEAGVGAIYTGASVTPFTLHDSDGGVSGRLSRSGVFLSESGQAGLVQQVDVAKPS